MVDFHYSQHTLQHPNTSFEEYAAHPGKWGRLAGSSVWIEEQRIYLMVTRIIFYLNGENNHLPMSFMRGQIFDFDWAHLEKYTLHWQDKTLIYPLIFDVDCPFTTDNGLFGPEDPRIIIEHDLPGAEPVVVFSMIMNTTTRRRAMALFRPFSNVTTVLTIEGREQKQTEKNLAPFFRLNRSREHHPDDGLQTPNPFLHFVYDMEPLQILKCNIALGNCTVMFEQDVQHDVSELHKQRASWGYMRGGTNFEPVRSQAHTFGDTDASMVHTYLGIPRTHVNSVCYRAMYRPEIMLLSSNSSHFWIAYTSGPLEMLEESATRDPCGQGRIIIVNSIAKIEKENGFFGGKMGGEVTISMSVCDSTVQVAKMGNVLGLVRNVLGRKTEEHGVLISGRDTLLCSVALATDYGVSVTGPVPGKAKFLDP
jgi:beta-1,2-mannosyltransferase